ncbi:MULTISPECIES: hypothetical protein [unclassified Methylobacterium]|uniref:hypothetical protein n=1 Tax=unclassified Methylobacterium TaxID=2615210 RepID=UPI0006FADE76|nr:MULTISPECIES: hypothetical protein [unclassified Methylobacterium]KQO59853.1 hypothetical protein ASF24_12165 [Methylobacterium sp. Leaf86]KQO85806.1 hypothetical protein ASF32_08895 [Methylobacterium sp. Leaf91]
MTLPAGPHAPLASCSTETAQALIETLSARLLGGDSATSVLEGWCRERRLASSANLVATRVVGPERQPSPVQGQRLDLSDGEVVRYRHVRLSWGGHVLSQAENWYVPARLTRKMNLLLDETEIPFGRVVHTLFPRRRNLRLLRLWPHDAGVPGPSDQVFAIEAILSDRSGRPICEVSETYTGAILVRGDD